MGLHDLNGGLISPSMAFHSERPQIGQIIFLPFLSEANSLSLKLSKIGSFLPVRPRLDTIKALIQVLVCDSGLTRHLQQFDPGMVRPTP